MNILATEYNLAHKALEVYVAGCTRRCPGCHNPETWDFSRGIPWRQWLMLHHSKLMAPLVDRVWVLGGEPLDQDRDSLCLFLSMLAGLRETWLWTSYGIDAVPSEIRRLVKAVKTGDYRKDLPPIVDPVTGIRLASSNQEIKWIQQDVNYPPLSAKEEPRDV